MAAGNDLYCICRKPDSGQWMIGCDYCEEWYHGKCVKIDECDSELIEQYCCPRCQSKKLGMTTWKKKCKLPNCRKPALFDKSSKLVRSKFCSSEHGIEWFKTNLELGQKQTRAEMNVIKINDLAEIIRNTRSFSEFRALGNERPSNLDKNREKILRLLDDERRVLASINDERAKLATKLKYIELKIAYVEYTHIRANGHKNVCGFDRKLVWEDMEWQVWCECDEGRRILDGVRKLKVEHEKKEHELQHQRSLEQTQSTDKKKKGRRRVQQQTQLTVDPEDVRKISNKDITDDEDICTNEKRRCQKHAGWHSIKLEESELDERVCRERLMKLEREEKAICERAAIRVFKDSIPRRGRCIEY
ncbi:hypothetical protein V1511DRAFT_505152 [Dipodascopsis uninucleata]